MQKIIFYSTYPLLWIISKMPFWLFYRVSDLIFLVVYYIIGYRKKLVLYNLKSAFPEKSESELLKIRRKYYRHFVDIFMEMIKAFTMTSQDLDKHFKILNNDLLAELAKKNKSVVLIGSHYANWEWALKIGQNSGLKPYVVFAKINNPVYSKKIISNRQRLGLNLITKAETLKTFAQNNHDGILSLYALLSDQSPQLKKSYYWSNFLGKRVPVLTGAEMLAKKYNQALVYLEINKIKRGYYTVEYHLMTENPRDYPDYELTELFLKKTEAQIKEYPEYYFWTHNRLKHIGKEHLSPAAKKLTK